MSYGIGQKFNTWKLLKFAFPTVIMMMIMSLYTIVDGIFISRYVGTDALSASNIVYPLINIIMAVSIMFANGGSAIIAKKMGANLIREAKQDFTLIVLLNVLFSILFSIICILFRVPLCRFLGANDALLGYCTDYLTIMMALSVANALQMLFNVFFVTAGVPIYGCILTIIAGVTNIFFDYVFMVPFQLGIKGAALGTGLAWLIPAGFGIFYFSRKKSDLHFVFLFHKKEEKKRSLLRIIDWSMIKEACFNGSSEMVTNLSNAIITLLFNLLMMKYVGQDGVAAVTIILYAQFLFTALYLGFSGGVAPIFSYNLGCEDFHQLKRLFSICIRFILFTSILLFAASMLFAPAIVSFFTPYGTNTYDISIRGFHLYSFMYLFSGINIFGSAYFTALSNGKISAILSFLRTFGFLLLGLLLLPFLFQVDGIWIATPLAEIGTIFITIYYCKRENLILWKNLDA